MKSLWFKQIYVDSILSGRKKDTIRKKTSRNPHEGEIVNLTVGPRPPFAKVIIKKNINLDISKISQIRKNQITLCYGEIKEQLIQIFFEIIPG